MSTETELKKKAIMVIETRIYVDGILMSEHSNHKIAIEKAKELQKKDDFKDRDILVYAPDKNLSNSTSTYRHHASLEENNLHTPKNITQGKVKKLRSPKSPKVPKEQTIEEMEAHLQELKNKLNAIK